MTTPQFEIRRVSTSEGTRRAVVTAYSPEHGEAVVAVPASSVDDGTLNAAIEHALMVKTSAASAARAD